MASPGELDNPPADPAVPALGPDFAAWAGRHVRSTFPDQTAGMSDAVLWELLHSWAERAACYSLETEEQVLCFAATAFLLGAGFDSDPNHAWAAEILADAELTPDERAAMMLAIAELLAEGEEAGDGNSG